MRPHDVRKHLVVFHLTGHLVLLSAQVNIYLGIMLDGSATCITMATLVKLFFFLFFGSSRQGQASAKESLLFHFL